MIEGTTVMMGGQGWVIPPLNLKSVRKIQPLIPVLNAMDIASPEAVDAMVELVFIALQRNYPDVTKDQVEDMVDLGNLQGIVNAVMNVSGLGPKAMTGAAPAPEASAAP
jgi:hypothetical protein